MRLLLPLSTVDESLLAFAAGRHIHISRDGRQYRERVGEIAVQTGRQAAVRPAGGSHRLGPARPPQTRRGQHSKAAARDARDSTAERLKTTAKLIGFSRPAARRRKAARPPSRSEIGRSSRVLVLFAGSASNVIRRSSDPPSGREDRSAPHQAEAVCAVYDFLRTRDDNPCIVIPTGGGKTRAIARSAAIRSSHGYGPCARSQRTSRNCWNSRLTSCAVSSPIFPWACTGSARACATRGRA